MHQPDINILVPLFNEEMVFDELISRLRTVMDQTQLQVTTILIDDGSIDKTPQLMESLALEDERFHCVFLSRNFGHQICLSAGLKESDAKQGVFIIDGDLQDPPELLDRFYEELVKGHDVVYGIRGNRKESFFKRMAYKGFYRFQKRVSNLDIPLDTGDFSMISRRVVSQLVAMREESRFLRGMRSWVGFNQIGIPYDRDERHSGESKYSLRKLLGLAANGIFNFSEFPIRFITRMGVATVVISSIYLLYTLYAKFALNEAPEGFTAVIFVLVLIGGVQLISIGIIGEYILRIFFQVKNRPLFVIDKVIKHKTIHGEELL